MNETRLWALEQEAQSGLSLLDSIMIVTRCSPAEAATIAEDAAVQAAHARGQASGARAIMIALNESARNGNTSAANAIIKVQKWQEKTETDAMIAEGRRRYGTADIARGVAASARKLAAEQRKYIQQNLRRLNEGIGDFNV
jgi:hypothetical protein